jgi:hypothetical protein
VNQQYGNDDFGNIKYVMIWIYSGMWITSISIRLNMGMLRVRLNGRIPHFIVTCDKGFIQWIGQAARM